MQPADIGSSDYYSVLYTDGRTQQLIIAYRELFYELHKVVLDCHEPQVASAKLEWWKNELAQPHSQHPRLKFFTSIDKKGFLTIVAALLRDLHTPQYDKQHQLIEFYRQTSGELESQLARIYHAQEETKENLCLFGIFMQLVTQLKDTRLLLNHGRSYLSGEMLIQHGVTLKELSELQLTNNIRKLFIAQYNLANSYYQQAQQNLTAKERKKIMPTLILAKIYKALLDEIERADFPVLKQRIGLTPLRKWWISWKCYLSQRLTVH